MRAKWPLVLVVVVTVTVAAGSVRAAGSSSAGVRVVAHGLNNPRGIAVAADGEVFVAQAGKAGPVCIGKGQNQQCGGFSSQISKIQNGDVVRVSGGFLSVGGKDGSFTVGADGIAVGPDYTLYTAMTSLGAKPPKGIPASALAQSGKLFKIGAHGRKIPLADISKVEFTRNPDGGMLDSDPYGVAWTPDGLLVADAAGNDLLQVHQDGSVSVVAVFPKRRFHGKRLESVPTSVALGPDGAYYVGELGGDGVRGMARIWRVVPGGEPEVFASGFTAIVGLSFGPDGDLYVAELVKHGLAAAKKGDLGGAIFRIESDGSREELAPGAFTAVGGVGVGPDGTVYVSVNAVFPQKGRVLALASS